MTIESIESLQIDEPAAHEAAWEMLAGMLPAEDWTAAARENRLEPAVESAADTVWARDFVIRALHRRRGNHVLVTGEKGVGKTMLVRELARRAARGDVPFLAEAWFPWVDCKKVGRPSAGGSELPVAGPPVSEPTLTGGRTFRTVPRPGRTPVRHGTRPPFSALHTTVFIVVSLGVAASSTRPYGHLDHVRNRWLRRPPQGR